MKIGDLAIDLGPANTLVFQEGRGIVFNEPTDTAVSGRDGVVLSMGDRAWEMVGHSPANVVAVRPLRRGIVTDYDLTLQMIRLILQDLGVTRFSRPRVLVAVPAGSTDVERRAVTDATRAAGAKDVSLIESPMAAAIGAGLPSGEPIGSFILDVGGGACEAAMIASGGIVAKRSARVGGFDMDAAIQHLVRDAYGVAIGDRAAERVKIAIGSAYPLFDDAATEVRGRDLATGSPRTVRLAREEVRDALAATVAAIVDATKECLADSPSELSYDVLERGMFLTGGTGQLGGLDVRISEECEVPVHLTERPLETVVIGAGMCLGMTPPADLIGSSAKKRAGLRTRGSWRSGG